MVSRLSSALPAKNHALDELLFGHFEADHMENLLAALLEEALQRLGLGYGAGESVENHPVLGLGLVVDDFLKYADHQRVGDELSLAYIGFGDLANRCLAGDVVAEYLSGRDVVQPVFLNKFLALGTFSATRSAENN